MRPLKSLAHTTMSPDGDGAINGCCPFSFSSGENGIPGSHDDTCKHCTRSQSLSSSPSALGSDSVLLVDSNKLRRIFVASAKGFSIGAGLKGGLALFSILAHLLRKKSRKVEGFTNKEAISLAIKETLRYGLFLGTFAGTFVSWIVKFCKRTAKWRALVAGLVAGPSMLLTGHNTQHKSLAIYILMRAAVLASRCGIKSKRFGKLCKPLTWKHGDIFLMCLSSSQILSSYILKQDSLPPSYRSFLNKHGGKDLVILQGVKEIASGLPFTNLEAIEKLYKASGVDVKLDPNMKIPCSAFHNIKKGYCWYCQIKLIFVCLLHICLDIRIVGFDKDSQHHSIISLLEVNPARLWTCLLFRLFRRCNIPMVAMGTFPTGLALAIEKKSRRIEISLYCLARAIESFFTCMADIGYLPQSTNLKRADVVIFSLSTAIIMHCYAQEREVFRSKYLNVLDWVFGVPPPPCETPRCKNISAV
ncbi:Transmembrane protein [Gossypium arboreum]|uniref:Transmembrane protein n=1 Tax=Gossypium arboreum TaxID=29729 RepID=A0A0B0N0M1_GOSAR|nr:Transmembrane protein [Gossypium arboreum]